MGKNKKIYISFDFEGIGGVSFWKETDGDMRWNRIATEQLKAFIDGIKAQDKDAEILISDSHSFGTSLIWEELEGVKLIRGWPRIYYMVEGLDNSFTDLVLFGYHTAIGGSGMMDHSYSLSSIYSIKINGEYLDEARINSYFAGELNVPLSFIYGDKQTVISSPAYPEIDYCISKEAISRFSGLMRPRKELLDELYEKGKNLGKKRKLLIPNPKDNGEIYPLYVEIEFTDSAKAKVTSILPEFNLINPRKVEFTCKNMDYFYRYLNAITLICSSTKNVM